jgi:hypothetical protein
LKKEIINKPSGDPGDKFQGLFNKSKIKVPKRPQMFSPTSNIPL